MRLEAVKLSAYLCPTFQQYKSSYSSISASERRKLLRKLLVVSIGA